VIGKVDAQKNSSVCSSIHYSLKIYRRDLNDRNMNQTDLLVMESVVNVLFDYSNVASRCCDAFGFYRLETVSVICQNEYVLVGAVEILNDSAGVGGIGYDYSALKRARKRSETDRRDMHVHIVRVLLGEI